MYKCPQNHESDAPDYCSVCGVELAPEAPTPAPAVPAGDCPECGTARESVRQAFCEVCGYNYRTGGSGIPPASKPTAIVPAAGNRQTLDHNPRKTLPASTPPSAARWDVEVAVDGSLYGKPNPDAPVDQPKQSFPLFDEEALVGRAGTEVRVQVPVRDPGVSRRQALLVRRNGSLFVRDLSSANGTQLNGKDLVPGVDTPLKDGDAIGIGAWTRLTVHAIASESEERQS